ncbi:MAG TPA: OmpA family protein [Streptosporangiaceae bacterium]|nr:OmpA family protein [Streptosporangiaceae bacterium]
MARIARHSYLAAGAAAMIAVTAGCGGVLGAPAADPATAAAAVTLTEQVAPALLVAVPGPSGTGQLLSQVVAATARPREDLDVLTAERGRALIASDSPPPATVVVPGRPAAPGAGASSYQQGRYRDALTYWRGQVAAGKRAVAARTRAAIAGWLRTLPLHAAVTGQPSSPAAATLPAECALATSAASGLINQAGAPFGARRVLLLFVTSLSGMPPSGELDGDDVIVVTSYLPTAAAASAAQVNLLAAGAARAAVLGPEVTAAQLDQLVSEGLGQPAVTEVLSGRALFANNSATLLPTAASVLAPLVAELRRPGASGVVNGFASAPGGAQHNQVLSQDRAAAVAAFLEARGVPKSALLVIGHGATNLVAPGSSGDNRRVVVVIEEPAGGSS